MAPINGGQVRQFANVGPENDAAVPRVIGGLDRHDAGEVIFVEELAARTRTQIASGGHVVIVALRNRKLLSCAGHVPLLVYSSPPWRRLSGQYLAHRAVIGPTPFFARHFQNSRLGISMSRAITVELRAFERSRWRFAAGLSAIDASRSKI